MSTKLITQLNPFSTNHNISEIENSSISEIIAKLDKGRAINTGWRVLLNDEIITDFEHQTNDGDTLYVKLVPEGDGSPQSVGKGEKWAGALLTAAGTALLFVPFVGPFAGAALIGAGVGIFANGVLLYNTDFSTLTKDRAQPEQPEQSPSIRGSKNQPRPLGYVPILFGKRRIYPDPATNPYTWVDENGDQYLYQLFCCGQKDQGIDTTSIRIGETPIKEYSSTGSLSSVLDGRDELVQLSISHGSETPPIVTRCVHEDMYNSVLLHETDDGTDASIIKTTPDDTEEINVDIFFYNGLGQYNDEGKVLEASVEVEVLYKKVSEDDSQYKVLGYFNSDSNTITGKELKTKRFSVTKSGLAKGKYTVKVTRKTNDSKDVKVIDTVFLGSIRSIKNQQPVSKARCRELTLVGLKIKVSSKLNGYVEQLNFVSQARNQIYNDITGKWETARTSNPASAAIYAMQGALSQQKLSDSEIDMPAFEKLFLWCEKNNYECNEYVYNSISISELLNLIALTCRAENFRLNGKITVIQDIKRDGFVQVFTPRNSWNYKETILKADIPDALSIQLTDEASNYAQQELKVYNTPDGNYKSEPETVQDMPLWGVTSNVQARKLGMYKYAVTKNRPIIHNFSCDFEYMLCSKGDWIKYAGDIALAGITQGRISEVIKNADGSTIGFLSDEKIPAMEDEKNYAVRIRLEDGSAVLVGLKNQDKETNLLEFEEDKNINIAEGCLFTYGVRGEDSIDLIITDIQCDDDLSASITAVSYSPEIFDVDNPNFVLPDFENRISDIPSVGDSGYISINDLETFVTYHDDFAIPETPLGDGTSNGWHLQKTPYARWQSTKLSKTVDTGKWSAPEQIITRGKSILKVYKEPEEYSSTIDGAIVNFRIKLDDIFESSTIDEVLLGDIIEYSVYHYEVVQRDNLYAYLGTLTSIQGPSGIDGADGKDGSDGNGIKSVAYYYTTTSVQNAPSPESVTNASIPILSATNKYLWQKEVITYTKTTTPKITVTLIGVYGDKGEKGDKGDTGPQGLKGEKGDTGTPGENGNGINSVSYFYAVTKENKIPNADSVTGTSIPSNFGATNRFLWQKEVITYTKTNAPKITVALICVYGEQGDRGSKWFSGTAMAGTGNKTITLSEETRVGDIYMNTSTSDTYFCTVGAAASQNSTWSFNGNIKGKPGASVTDVVLSSATVPITTKIDGKTDDTGTYTINFHGRTGATAKNVTAVSCSSLPNGLTVTIPTTTTKNSITFLWDNAVDIGNGNTSGDLDLTLTCDGKTIVKKVTWTKVVSKLVVDELLVNKLKSMNFSNIAGQEDGFCFNGTNAEIDFGNGVVIPANTEYHYGNAIYESAYMKNSDNMFCVAFGKDAGYIARKRGNWNSSTTYESRDVVIYDSKYFMSKGDSNKNNVPAKGDSSDSYWSLLSSYDADSVAMGVNSLKNISYGYNNVAIGRNALRYGTTIFNNVVIGTDAVVNKNSCARTVAIGAQVLQADIFSDWSVVIGCQALQNGGGYYNVAIGASALQVGNSNFNVVIGTSAMMYNEDGSNNVVVGYSSASQKHGYNNVVLGSLAMQGSGDYTPHDNIVIGYNAGGLVENASNCICIGKGAKLGGDNSTDNIVVGRYAFSSTSSGNGNVIIGSNAGTNITFGSNNVLIGYNVQAPSTGGWYNYVNIANVLTWDSTNGLKLAFRKDGVLKSGLTVVSLLDGIIYDGKFAFIDVPNNKPCFIVNVHANSRALYMACNTDYVANSIVCLGGADDLSFTWYDHESLKITVPYGIGGRVYAFYLDIL